MWKFETGGPLLSGPAVADGVVYIGSVDRFFYAVEGQTGEELWRFQSWGCDSSPVIGDGAVYFTGIDSNIYAIGDPQ